MTPARLEPTACHFVVVEDAVLLRDLIGITLESWFRPRRSTTFSTGRAALRAIAEEPPDVLVTDLTLPDLDGREIIRDLRRRGARSRVVVLTGRNDATLPAELIALGVAGLVDKSLASLELRTAIDRVLQGGLYYSSAAAPRPSPLLATAASPTPGDGLSPREREIARLVASGLSSKEVAVRMNLAPRTVEKYRATIMAKIAVRDFAGLVRWCVQNGLV